jgi:hypothetical protein
MRSEDREEEPTVRSSSDRLVDSLKDDIGRYPIDERVQRMFQALRLETSLGFDEEVRHLLLR